jgi:outer membrane receptor protein involved in Fe transport
MAATRRSFCSAITRHHENGGESVLRDVPSPEMLAGNFSFGGVGQPIYDPLTTRLEGTTWVRTPLPGNIVPQSRFDPVAKAFLAQNPFTAQNKPGNIDRLGPHENYANTTAYKSFRTRFDVKIDHQFTSNNRMFVRYSQSHHRAYSDRWALEIDWRLIDPNTVPIPIDQEKSCCPISGPSARRQSTRSSGNEPAQVHPRTRSQWQGWAKKLGIPNVSDETFPGFNISTYNYRMQPGGYQQDVGEDFTFQNNLTKVRGKHTLKFGYETIRTRYNSLAQALPSGTYTMGGTDAPFVANTGNNFASFLLGSVSSATFTQAVASWLPRWWSHAFYAQTDWKPSATSPLISACAGATKRPSTPSMASNRSSIPTCAMRSAAAWAPLCMAKGSFPAAT